MLIFSSLTKARFEWDENKDAENQKKHGILFRWLNMRLPMQTA